MSILSLLSSVLLTEVKCLRIIYSPARLSSTFSSLAAVKIRKQFTSVLSLEIPNRLSKMTLKFPQKAASFSLAVQMISPRRILMLQNSSVGACPRRYLIRLYSLQPNNMSLGLCTHLPKRKCQTSGKLS